ncbi:transposon Ty3-G Gag-Pol polyprotein [Trichonephila clavata]|uniref:Transposon Ty3-G Gag-Pol polyprotein n=1 Tax=Trichonephila clavata TaxID=2740835 RepID=A0A8X6KEM5_TRICU|nr:transposon Ty3-G Gag-Pol polyprotein [Trichonephila clavata]
MNENNEMAVVDSNEQKFDANKVSVKIPPFWEKKPEIWFFQVEAQFSIANINQEETKLNYLVAQLDPKFIENIWNIIQSNEKNKYSCAKSRLLSTFKESDEKSIKQLLTGISLGDMKHSQLLRKMKSLAGDNITENVLRFQNYTSTEENQEANLEISVKQVIKAEVDLENASIPKENIAIFTSISVRDANLKNAAGLCVEWKYGKLQSAVNIATHSAAEHYEACRKFRLFVKDRTTNLHFLVDSGADCSIIPATSKNKQPSDYKLFAVNGTETPTYGIKVLKIDLGLRREFLFPFMFAKVSKGILGADILHKFK